MTSQEFTVLRDRYFQEARQIDPALLPRMCQFLLAPVGLRGSTALNGVEEDFSNKLLNGLVENSREFLSRFMNDPEARSTFELAEVNPTLVVRQSKMSAPRAPCLFLDRDGTIIDLIPYVKDPALVCLRPGIVDRIREARAMGWWVIGVTNQSGIGRGYYTWAEYQGIQDRMCNLLAGEGVHLDHTFAAGYYPESKLAIGHFFPELRKPAPGMVEAACKYWPIDLAASVMMGDSDVDEGLARSAGIGHYVSLKEVAPDHPSTHLAQFLKN